MGRIQIAVNLFVDLDEQQLNIYHGKNRKVTFLLYFFLSLPRASKTFPLQSAHSHVEIQRRVKFLWRAGRMLCFPADATCQAAERKWDSRCNFGWPVECKQRQAGRNEGGLTYFGGDGGRSQSARNTRHVTEMLGALLIFVRASLFPFPFAPLWHFLFTRQGSARAPTESILLKFW